MKAVDSLMKLLTHVIKAGANVSELLCHVVEEFCEFVLTHRYVLVCAYGRGLGRVERTITSRRCPELCRLLVTSRHAQGPSTGGIPKRLSARMLAKPEPISVNPWLL